MKVFQKIKQNTFQKTSIFFKTHSFSSFSISNKDKYHQTEEWTFSEESMLKHLNIIDPIYKQVKSEQTMNLNRLKSRFLHKRQVNEGLVEAEYNRLFNKMNFSQKGDYPNPILSDNQREKYSETLGIDIKNDDLLRKTVIISFYDNKNLSYLTIEALKGFLNSLKEVEHIRIYEDMQGCFSFGKIIFSSEEQAKKFRFQYTYKHIEEIISSIGYENIINSTMNPNQEQCKNLLVVNSFIDFYKEKKSDRTLIFSNIPPTVKESELLELCSKYGSVLNIYMPKINTFQKEMNSKIYDESTVVSQIYNRKLSDMLTISELQQKENPIQNLYYLIRLNDAIEKYKTTVPNQIRNKSNYYTGPSLNNLSLIQFYINKLFKNPYDIIVNITEDIDLFILNKSFSDYSETVLLEKDKKINENLNKIKDLNNDIILKLRELISSKSESILELESKKLVDKYLYDNPLSIFNSKNFFDDYLKKVNFMFSLSKEEISQLKGKFDIDIHSTLPQFIDYFLQFSKKHRIDIFEKHLSLTKELFKLDPLKRISFGRSIAEKINSKSPHQGLSNDVLNYLNIKVMRKIPSTSKLKKLISRYGYELNKNPKYYQRFLMKSDIYFKDYESFLELNSIPFKVFGKLKYLQYIIPINLKRRIGVIKELKSKMDNYNLHIEAFTCALKNTPEEIKKKYEKEIKMLTQVRFASDYEVPSSSFNHNLKKRPSYVYRLNRLKYNYKSGPNEVYLNEEDVNNLTPNEYFSKRKHQLEIEKEENKYISNFLDMGEDEGMNEFYKKVEKIEESEKKEVPLFPIHGFIKFEPNQKDLDEIMKMYYEKYPEKRNEVDEKIMRMEELEKKENQLNIEEHEELKKTKEGSKEEKKIIEKYDKIHEKLYSIEELDVDFSDLKVYDIAIEYYNKKKNITNSYKSLNETELKESIEHFMSRKDNILYQVLNLRSNKAVKNAAAELNEQNLKRKIYNQIKTVYGHDKALLASKLKDFHEYTRRNIYNDESSLKEFTYTFSDQAVDLVYKEMEYLNIVKQFRSLIDKLTDEVQVPINKSNVLPIYSIYNSFRDALKYYDDESYNKKYKSSRKYMNKGMKFSTKEKGTPSVRYFSLVKENYENDQKFLEDLKKVVDCEVTNEEKKFNSEFIDNYLLTKEWYSKELKEKLLNSIGELSSKSVELANFQMDFLFKDKEQKGKFSTNEEKLKLNSQNLLLNQYSNSNIINKIAKEISNNDEYKLNSTFAFVTFSNSISCKKLYMRSKESLIDIINLNGIQVEPQLMRTPEEFSSKEILQNLSKERNLINKQELLAKAENDLKEYNRKIEMNKEKDTRDFIDKALKGVGIIEKERIYERKNEETKEMKSYKLIEMFENLKSKENLLDDYELNEIMKSKGVKLELTNNKEALFKKEISKKKEKIEKIMNNPYELDHLYTEGVNSEIVEDKYSSLFFNIKGRQKQITISKVLSDIAERTENSIYPFEENKEKDDNLKKIFINKERSLKERFPKEKYISKQVNEYKNKNDKINKDFVEYLRSSYTPKTTATGDVIEDVVPLNTKTQMLIHERETIYSDPLIETSMTIQRICERALNDDVFVDRDLNIDWDKIEEDRYLEKRRAIFKYNHLIEKKEEKKLSIYLPPRLDKKELLEEDDDNIDKDYNNLDEESADESGDEEEIKVERDLSFFGFISRRKEAFEKKEDKKVDSKINNETQIDVSLGSEESIKKIRVKYNKSQVKSSEKEEALFNLNESNLKSKKIINLIKKRDMIQSEERHKKFISFIENNFKDELEVLPTFNKWFEYEKNKDEHIKYIESKEMKERNEGKVINDKLKLKMKLNLLEKGIVSNEKFEEFFKSYENEYKTQMDEWLTQEDIDIIAACEKKLDDGEFDFYNGEESSEKLLFRQNEFSTFNFYSESWRREIMNNLKKDIKPMILSQYSSDSMDLEYYIPIKEISRHLSEISHEKGVNIKLIKYEKDRILIRKEYIVKYKYNINQILNPDLSRNSSKIKKNVNNFFLFFKKKLDIISKISFLLASYKDIKSLTSKDRDYSSNINEIISFIKEYNKSISAIGFISLIRKLQHKETSNLTEILESIDNMRELIVYYSNKNEAEDKDVEGKSNDEKHIVNIKSFIVNNEKLNLSLNEINLLIDLIYIKEKLSFRELKEMIEEKKLNINKVLEIILKDFMKKAGEVLSKENLLILYYLLYITPDMTEVEKRFYLKTKHILIEDLKKKPVSPFVENLNEFEFISEADLKDDIKNFIGIFNNIYSYNMKYDNEKEKEKEKEIDMELLKIKSKCLEYCEDLVKLHPEDDLLKKIDDPEVFEKEISEQKQRFIYKEKVKKLENKDLVAKRENEWKVYDSQKEYFANYSTLIQRKYEEIVNSDLSKEINNLIKENEIRNKKLLDEGRALLIREYNRII